MYNLDVLEQIKKDAIANHIPILMDETLDEILDILKEENPKQILEIGTAIGYSASQFAITIPDVHIDTIELDEERANQAKENIKNVGTESQITIYQGVIFLKDNKKSFKDKKDNMLKSLKEVENFLWNWKKASKGINLYKALKK